MNNNNILMNPNQLVQFLKKPASNFTKADLVKFIEAKGIEMINFRYVAEDGKLKSLNFVLSSREHLEQILTTGERVDGSSLFSFVGAGSSDLYVIPRYRTAFLNPFTEEPTLEILCSFYNSEGNPLDSAPENILRKAYSKFREESGMRMKALGELEYYVRSYKDDLYPLVDQKGYHQTKPFAKFEDLRVEALRLCASAGCRIKYGHSEVGSFTSEGEDYEQHEIEFLPCEVEEAVDQLVIAKWIVRMLGFEYGVEVSFAPKITVGKAGSGLHIHMLLEKDGRNAMVDGAKLSDTAKKMIAGILRFSKSLTAFGNTIPTSYLRLVPHQEAPTNICWGDRNRSVLVRVPLGWLGKSDMILDANPGEDSDIQLTDSKQTVEFRAPDGSADLYLLMAGLVMAAGYGLRDDKSLRVAEDLYVSVNIFSEENRSRLESLDSLPASCFESAECLGEDRQLYQEGEVFPSGLIDNIISRLKSFDDRDLSERLYGKKEEISELVNRFLHCS
ncbi:MAG: glutamine synthetase family protein [Marinilabiliaceae bacterium]|nr:glutamine synthetase family protein [Marinilabiliaceae bacterium]